MTTPTRGPAVDQLAAELRSVETHSADAGLARLHVGLSASLGFTVGINAYLSAPGAVALKPHTDGHDVAVLQLQGRTRWNVCPAATADR